MINYHAIFFYQIHLFKIPFFDSPLQQGGAIVLSGGENYGDSPGGMLYLRNSTFIDCSAGRETGGVVYMNEYAIANIEGDDNK